MLNSSVYVYRACLSANDSIDLVHPGFAKQRNATAKLLHGMIISGAIAAMLATAGCDSGPPVASYGPDLSGIETMALRGDPYARAALTPTQRQRVNAYQANHPGTTPSSWSRDTMNIAVGAGGGYLAGSTMSAAQTGAAVTTGEVVTSEVAPEVVGPLVERAAAGEVIGDAVVGSEVVEGAELLEVLEGACLLLCW